MKEWYSISDLLALKEHSLPSSRMGMFNFARDRSWNDSEEYSRSISAQGGDQMEYHYRVFPDWLQSIVIAKDLTEEAQNPSEVEADIIRSEALWDVYSRAGEKAKKTAERKHELMLAVTALEATMTTHLAVTFVSKEHEVSARTLYRWYEEIKGLHKGDWLPALLPRQAGKVETCEYDSRIYEVIKWDYLRPEEPSWASCYRRVEEIAQDKGWGFVPNSKTLRRHLNAKVPVASQMMMRKGKSAAAALYPAQERIRSHLHAMQGVNADGHMLDILVEWEDGTKGRPQLVGFQDLYSGMIVSHRISKTENQDTVRLAIADMVESWGIPEKVYFDNGRAFASKWLTGGMDFRFRFKVKSEEPQGILKNLGVDVHFVQPYSGQSKPIERAWRDLADDISRNPKIAGAYTGNSVANKPDNYGEKYIPIAKLREIVSTEIMRHNTRAGRRSKIANGRSFFETFKHSLEQSGTLVRKATELQRQYFLLAGESKMARSKNGEIFLGENRYWHPDLVAYRGKKLMIRFDPECLHDDLFVYTLDGRFITKAECIEAVGFDSSTAAREHARKRRRFNKITREALELEKQLSPEHIGAEMPDPDPIEMPSANVVGMIQGNRALKPIPHPEDDAEAFARGVTQMFPVDE